MVPINSSLLVSRSIAFLRGGHMERYGTLRAYSEEAACDMVLQLIKC